MVIGAGAAVVCGVALSRRPEEDEPRTVEARPARVPRRALPEPREEAPPKIAPAPASPAAVVPVFAPEPPRKIVREPPPGAREQRTILRFDFEHGLPKGWRGELETEVLPPGSTGAFRAVERGEGYFLAASPWNTKGHFRAAKGTVFSFDCHSSHAISVSLEICVESPEENGNFCRRFEAPAGKWMHIEAPMMDLVRDESGNSTPEGAVCCEMKFKLFNAPQGLRFVVDNIEISD